MYVTGRNKTGTGTILSSVAEMSKNVNFEKITVASKSKSSQLDVKNALNRTNKLLGTHIDAEFEALGERPVEKLSELCKQGTYDAAIVSVPDHLHFENVKVVLQNSIHSLVVKPLTPTRKEALDLIKIQKKNNLLGCVEFHKRFDETNLYIKKALAEKMVGKLLYFTVDYSQRIDIPLKTFSSWAHQTNIFQYLGVHYVDLIYFLTGYLPTSLSAFGMKGILRSKGIDTFDSVHAQILWKDTKSDDQFISSFNTNWIDPSVTSALSDQKYKVVGTLGRIECDQKNRGVELVTERTGIQQINPYFSDFLPDENGALKFGGYGHKSIERFILDVIDLKKKKVSLTLLEKNRPSFRQALVSTAVIEAANKSLVRNAEWIKIEV